MVGKFIRMLRYERGITMYELAAASGVSRAYLSRVETELMTPSLGILEKIADGFGVSLNFLLSGHKEFIEFTWPGKTNVESLGPFITDIYHELLSLPAEKRVTALRSLAAMIKYTKNVDGLFSDSA